MARLVRRSWALRGHTPLLYQRTRSHKKVSAIAALCIGAADEALSLCFRLHANASIDSARVVEFLRHLMRHRRRAIMLIWDRLNAHRSAQTREFLRANRSQLHTYFRPPYAPELNPVEQVWAYLKMNPLANYPIHETDQLASVARCHGRSAQHRPALLQAFLQHTPLSFSFK